MKAHEDSRGRAAGRRLALGLPVLLLGAGTSIAAAPPLTTAGDPVRGQDCGEWYYYLNEDDECRALELLETELAVISPAASTTVEEILAVLGSLGEPRFVPYFEMGGLFHQPNASAVPADVRFLRRPAGPGPPLRALVAQAVARPANAWYWTPMFGISGFRLAPGQQMAARFVPATPLPTVSAVIEEEAPGSSIEPWLGLDTYWIVTPHLDGFEVLLASNRLHLRAEIRWADPNFFGFGGGPSGEPPDGPGPVAIPMLGPLGLLSLAIAIGLAGLAFSRSPP